MNSENHFLTVRGANVTDHQSLLSDIKEAQRSDQSQLKPLVDGENLEDHCWTEEEDGMRYYKRQVYVPDTGDLCLQVLKSNHDHVLAGHPGQSKTYQLVRQEFNWPNLREFVVDYVRSFVERTRPAIISRTDCSSSSQFHPAPGNLSRWISSSNYHHQRVIQTS